MRQHTFHYLLLTVTVILTSWPAQSTTQQTWWKEAVFYQIYMPSFQDSNGDGYSDFTGMTSRLDYLQSLGIKGIWLTPFLKSPKVDNGYDVADYYQIDPVYGTMKDFQHFLDEAHRRGIHVIMDMVVNHTSTDHHWFQESRKSKDNPYRDYYIWRNKPNNWESYFGGGAWALDSLTGHYYLHQFAVRMADLNWSNPKVVDEVRQVLRYWLDKGIDGFRFDVINNLKTDTVLPDNPIVNGVQKHLYDENQSGVKKMMSLLKKTINDYPDKFEVGEISSDKIEVLSQYQSPQLMDVVFNFNFGSMPHFSVERIFNELQHMNQTMTGFPTLFFGSHDNPRLMNRMANGNPERAEELAALILTAKGIPFVYYGEEIGMENIEAKTYNEIADIQGKTFYNLAVKDGKAPEEALKWGNEHNRDKSRSPMQWDNSVNGGFTAGKPWIKLHENLPVVNVRLEEQQPNSILNTYKKLIAIRNAEKALQYGDYMRLERHGDLILYARSYEGTTVTVVLNFGKKARITVPNDATILMGVMPLKTNGYLIYKQS